MQERLAQAIRFRLSAERLRAIAGQSDNEEDRELSLAIASNYERLADRLEKLASADGIAPTATSLHVHSDPPTRP